LKLEALSLARATGPLARRQLRRGGLRRRESEGVYLTSEFITSLRPTTAGRTTQVAAVTATLAHCSPVSEPVNRAAWA
jgi:hypothetical protein